MSGSVGSQRGFTMIDTIVAIALVGCALVAVTAVHGARPPQRRAAALDLQGALAETRALAASNADGMGTTPTGATLSVTPLAGRGAQIAVYASRPIAGAPPLTPDPGFPPLTVPVTVSVSGQAQTPAPFTIFVSSSGYASVATDYAYDPAQPRSLAADPGCDEVGGVTISIADDIATETHPFACRGALYDIDTNVVPVTSSALP